MSRCISALAVLDMVVHLSLQLSSGLPLATYSATSWLCSVCCFVTQWKEEGMTSTWWCRRSRRTTPTEGAIESFLLTQDVMTPWVLHRAKSFFYFLFFASVMSQILHCSSFKLLGEENRAFTISGIRQLHLHTLAPLCDLLKMRENNCSTNPPSRRQIPNFSDLV